MTVAPSDAPAADHKATVGFVRELYSEARREKRKVTPRWNKYYRLLRNRTWSEYRTNWMPSPQSSEIFPTFHTLVSWMTSERPQAFFSPSHDLQGFNAPPPAEILERKAADLASSVGSWWVTAGAPTQVQMSLWDCMTFGTGVLKTGWDQQANNGIGDATMGRVDPYAVLPDPSASSFDDARYVLEVRRVPLYDLRRRYPERGHLVKPDGDELGENDKRPNEKSNFDVERQSNFASTGVTGTFPGTATPGIPPLWGPGGSRDEYTGSALEMQLWVRSENRVLLPVIEDGDVVEEIEMSSPRWDMIAVAGDVVLTPEVRNPFDHGQLPYHRIPFADVGEFWAIPLAEHLSAPQIALNRLLAALQLNAELTGNPILLDDKNSGISRTKILNRPGGRLTKNNASEIRWLEPPRMQPTILDLVGYWRDTIDRISGISAIARGAAFRRREPAQAVDTVMEASSVRIQAVLRNMEEALRVALQQVGANMCSYYLEPRIVPLVGPSGSEEFLQLASRHFYFPELQPDGGNKDIPLSFDCWIEAGSSLPISHQAKIAEMDTLFFMGVADEQAVLETHKVPGWRKILERVQQKQQQAAMQEAQGAAPQGQGGQPTDPRRRPGGPS